MSAYIRLDYLVFVPHTIQLPAPAFIFDVRGEVLFPTNDILLSCTAATKSATVPYL